MWMLYTEQISNKLADGNLRKRYLLPLETLSTLLCDIVVTLVSNRLYLHNYKKQLQEVIK